MFSAHALREWAWSRAHIYVTIFTDFAQNYSVGYLLEFHDIILFPAKYSITCLGSLGLRVLYPMLTTFSLMASELCTVSPNCFWHPFILCGWSLSQKYLATVHRAQGLSLVYIVEPSCSEAICPEAYKV